MVLKGNYYYLFQTSFRVVSNIFIQNTIKLNNETNLIPEAKTKVVKRIAKAIWRLLIFEAILL